MKKVKILIDSVADILIFDGEETKDKFDIDFIPLHVNLKGQDYHDFIDIRPKQLFEKVDELKATPKTSCPSPVEYYKFFKKYSDEYDIVFFSIGSELSGGYKAANIAKEEIENSNIYIIDSQNISSGEGILALRAIKLRDLGYSAKEIYEDTTKNIRNSKCKFVVDTMEYLYKGGRCSSLTALIGSILRIKPVITSTNGKLSVYAKSLGKTRGLKVLLDSFKEDFIKDNIVMDNILITHAESDEEEIYLKEKLIEMGVDKNIIHATKANCTVASHCGPKTIGIIYMVKNN